MKTYIYRHQTIVAQANTPEILSCQEDRWFGITWESGVLELKEYSQNGRRFLAYSDINDDTDLKTSDIHGLTVSTSMGVTGQFGLPRIPGMYQKEYIKQVSFWKRVTTISCKITVFTVGTVRQN